MAYSELVKNFNRIRDYMREFYVYGFKSREEYTGKSARSYDDERRRLESWLGDYMQFRRTPEGKNVFLSIDSRLSRHNPLYKAWKAKSFTDGDITLHFILMDILAPDGEAMSVGGITGRMDEYFSAFAEPRLFDESTVRKKLREYAAEGILAVEKRGKTLYYRRVSDAVQCDADVLDFFSEVSLCGVIGSFLLDKAGADKEGLHRIEADRTDTDKAEPYKAGAPSAEPPKTGMPYRAEPCKAGAHRAESYKAGTRREGSDKTRLQKEELLQAEMPCRAEPCKAGMLGAKPHRGNFAFKHHYITGAMDSEIVYQLLEAMHEKRHATLETVNRQRGRVSKNSVVPLRILISVQSGRQYIMAYVPRSRRIKSFRMDNIVSVKPGEVCGNFEELRGKLESMQPHMWGVSTQGRSGRRTEHVEFTVRYGNDEQHIHRRLEREKRCGTVERIDGNTSRFSAEVYDASEMIPWIRTFICRITEISFSDPGTEAQFRGDLEEMYRLYGLEGGEGE